MLACVRMTRSCTWAQRFGQLVLGALLVRSLFAVPYLPTNDGPEHVMASHMEDHFADPGTLYADRLRPRRSTLREVSACCTARSRTGSGGA